MIRSFKHKGLKELFTTGSSRRIMPGWKKRLLLRLGVLDDAQSLDDIDLPAFHLHPLKGDRAGEWAIDVSGNYRMTFRPETRAREEEAFEVWDVDLEDYH